MKFPIDDPLRRILDQVQEDQRRFQELAQAPALDHIRIMGDELARSAALGVSSYDLSLDLQRALHTMPPTPSVPELELSAYRIRASELAGDILEEIRKQNDTIASIETIWAFDRQRVENLVDNQHRLREYAATQWDFAAALAPSRGIEAAIAAIEATARLNTAPVEYWRNSLAVVDSFGDFALRQAETSRRDEPRVAARRARVTELAVGLLETTVAAANRGIELGDGEQEVQELEPRLYAPLNQHLGFVYRVDSQVDVDASVAASVPAQICHLGMALLDLVYRLNTLWRLAGNGDLFKPTNRSMQACGMVACVVVGSSDRFGQLVDSLYFLLYEGAGGASSRLAGLLPDDDLEPLWRLKHLRLHYSHDIEHGPERDIARKYANIANAFKSLVGCSLPTSARQWCAAQLALYGQVVGMLERLESAIVRSE